MYILFLTFRYLTRKKPVQPLFQSRIEPVNDAVQIIARTGATGYIKFFKGRSLTSATGNINNAIITGLPSQYNAVVEVFGTWTVKPQGLWWEVVERNQVILAPLDLANRGWIFQLI